MRSTCRELLPFWNFYNIWLSSWVLLYRGVFHSCMSSRPDQPSRLVQRDTVLLSTCRELLPFWNFYNNSLSSWVLLYRGVFHSCMSSRPDQPSRFVQRGSVL